LNEYVFDVHYDYFIGEYKNKENIKKYYRGKSVGNKKMGIGVIWAFSP